MRVLVSNERIGLWSAAALVVGHTIGVGIFLTPAQLIGALGSPGLSLGLWIASGVLVLAGALTFGALAALYPRSGGLYVYLRETLGPRAAFLFGWQAALVMDPGITAALATGLSRYVVLLWPAARGHERGVAIAAIWILAAANMAGLRVGVAVQNALTVLKLTALAAIVGGAFASSAGSWTHFAPLFERRPGSPPLGEALGLGLVAVFFSFGGFWEPGRVAGEVRNPRAVVPRALTLGVATVTLVYVAVTAALIYLVPVGPAESAAGLTARAGEAAFGRAGAPILAAAVAVSVAGSAMALMLMAPRVYVAMASDGLFPAALASLHPRTGSPARATALLASLASLLVLSGTFDQIVAFFLGVALVFVGLAAVGLVVATRRSISPDRSRSDGRTRTIAVLFAVFLGAVVASIALARPLQVLAGFALVLLGIPAYGALAPRASSRAPNGDP
jgi:basic amino acid/polyamine antiporter, APA family